MRVLIKYRLTLRAESFARELVDLSRRLRAFTALMRDSSRAQFVAVARPAALPRLETARLFAELRRLDVGSRTLIVNAETNGTCRACRRRASAEARQVRALRRTCRGKSRRCGIIHAPLQLPPPQGAVELLQWSTTWRSDGDK